MQPFDNSNLTYAALPPKSLPIPWLDGLKIFFVGSTHCFKNIENSHKNIISRPWAPLLRCENWRLILRMEGTKRSMTKMIISKIIVMREIIAVRINYFTRKKNKMRSNRNLQND